MKQILILLAFILCVPAFGQGEPITKVRGDLDSAFVSGTKLVFPGHVTSAASYKLIDWHGGDLVNPSFEHATYNTGWTATTTAGTFTPSLETTEVMPGMGSNSVKITLTAGAGTYCQEVTPANAAKAAGSQGFSQLWVKTNVPGSQVCPKVDGVVLSCSDDMPQGAWSPIEIPMVLGSTSYGVCFKQSTAQTGVVYIDGGGAGRRQPGRVGSISQGRLAGMAYFAATASATCTRTSTTLGALSCNAALPGPNITYASLGDWQTTDADLLKVTVNNLPAGACKATYDIKVSAGSNINYSLAITDGTTTGVDSQGANGSNAIGQTVSQVFNYTSSGNRSFELYTRSASGAITVDNTTSTGYAFNTKFYLECWPPPAAYVTQNSPNYDWVAYTPSPVGLGTVTNLNCFHARDGSDLLIQCGLTTGTTTATEARLPLPNSLTMSSVFTGIKVVGSMLTTTSSTTFFGNAVMAEPGNNYLVFGTQTSTAGALTKANGNALLSSSTNAVINARVPIQGWSNSNLIIGTMKEAIKSVGNPKPVHCEAQCGITNESSTCTSTGACALFRQRGDCGFTCTKTATTGTYTWTADSAKINSATASCKAQVMAAGSPSNVQCDSGLNSSNAFTVVCQNGNTNALANAIHTVECDGDAP